MLSQEKNVLGIHKQVSFPVPYHNQTGYEQHPAEMVFMIHADSVASDHPGSMI